MSVRPSKAAGRMYNAGEDEIFRAPGKIHMFAFIPAMEEV
jgi:hypothetical protein